MPVVNEDFIISSIEGFEGSPEGDYIGDIGGEGGTAPPPDTSPPVYSPPTTTTPPGDTTTTPPEDTGGGLLNQGATLEELRVTAPEIAAATPAPGVDATQAGVTEAEAAVPVVSGVAGAQQATATGAGAEGYDPSQLAVTPEMTVAGQLQQITSGDSPLMALARKQGLLSAGRRGLMNSSIAAQAAQAATVERALPIAQQDAATHLRAAEANQQALNRAKEFGASAKNIAELQNAVESNKLDALNAQLGTDVSKFNADQRNEAENLAAQMQTAVNQGNADAYNKAQQQFAELQTRADMEVAAQTFAASQQSAAATNTINQQVLQANAQLNAQYLAGTQALDIAQIQGQYQNLISRNESAARIYDSYFSGISSIMANPDISPERAAQHVQAQLRQLNGALTYIQEMNNVDLAAFQPTMGTAPAPVAVA